MGIFMKKFKQFPTGKYTGDLKNGQPHGKGTLTFGSHKYVGQFKDGKIHGKGKSIDVWGGVKLCTYKNGKLINEKIIKKAKPPPWVSLTNIIFYLILLGFIYLFYSITRFFIG